MVEVEVTSSGGDVTVTGGAVIVCVCSTVEAGSFSVLVVPSSV